MSGETKAETKSEAALSNVLNINVGVLGHVDSGKTSLSKALSTTLSTASLDKNPTSQERGITIDLGFSAFFLDVPAHLKDKEGKSKYDKVQITLVDCPGHASLIKTIIGGAQIIDMVLLVVDVTKGIQTQTAECLVIAEILVDKMVVVLNKVDLLKNASVELPKIIEKLRDKVFKTTKFGKDVPMVAVSANPGGTDENLRPGRSGPDAEKTIQKPNVKELLDYLSKNAFVPKRAEAGSFYFAVDHCFNIKGRGQVLTGTVLAGSVSVNSTIELPTLKLERQVKSMQMFHKPVQSATQGDRVGICVTQLDPKQIERTIACAPGTVGSFSSVLAVVNKVRFFKGAVENKAKFHVTIGHETQMATAFFFGLPEKPGAEAKEMKNEETKEGQGKGKGKAEEVIIVHDKDLPTKFDFSQEYTRRKELLPVSSANMPGTQFAVLQFDKPVTCPLKSVIIGSRLDTDVQVYQNSCRLAFAGRLLEGIDWDDAKQRERIKLFALKERTGTIDRVADEYTLIGRDLFAKGTDISPFLGMKVTLATGEVGRIDSTFGKGGKFKVVFEKKLPLEGTAAAAASSEAKDEVAGGGDDDAAAGDDDDGKEEAEAGPRGRKGKGKSLKGKIFLRFKKYLNTEKRTLVQS